jgi:hypothetical protein
MKKSSRAAGTAGYRGEVSVLTLHLIESAGTVFGAVVVAADVGQRCVASGGISGQSPAQAFV